PPIPIFDPHNAPQAILNENGHSLLTRIAGSLTYDTRNSTYLPDAGQETKLLSEFTSSYLGGERDYWKLELSSAWYFRGFAKGHVLELVGRAGVADGLNGDTVPFYDRYYLGGLYSLRGFKYRSISPRELNPTTGGFFSEPIGGNTYWFASAEYSIPIVQKENLGGVRFAVFYDIGNVQSDSFAFKLSNFSDNWGIGLRLNLPIGPLRLDYGIPIHHDQFNDSSGRFQFGVGWQRPF
ncbi:MAG TPA: BamA/TamA family outer membrane protein, partial [Verrucomicrobiae bacterium]|nr:BamA/TamA family outer membrane protein [Verrucomicrobiae bacterium]